MKIDDLKEAGIPGLPYNDDDETPEQLAKEERDHQIFQVEQQMQQQYSKAYAAAGISLFEDPKSYGPVIVQFEENEGIVELSVTTGDSFTLDALIKLSEQNLIRPDTSIAAGSNYELRIETRFPAAETPFRRFMNGGS